jgi:hypothetical protein
MSFGNPERNAMNNLDRRTRGTTIEESVQALLPLHEQARRETNKIAIDHRDFADLYSQQSIDHDSAYIANREKDFEVNNVTRLSEIAEYQIIKGLNEGHWIPNCEAIKTSRYDDIHNGVDMVIEFSPENGTVGQIGLGVDISFSLDLGKKFLRIKQEIDTFDNDKNRLAVVKYYKSKSGFRGELSGIPRVVAALDVGVLQDISHSRRSADHIARHILIEEIRHQLDVLTEYAARVNPACVPNLERGEKFITTISEQLKSTRTLAQSEYLKNRKIDDAIERNLNMFKK